MEATTKHLPTGRRRRRRRRRRRVQPGQLSNFLPERTPDYLDCPTTLAVLRGKHPDPAGLAFSPAAEAADATEAAEADSEADTFLF
jgi:hypothetical protein